MKLIDVLNQIDKIDDSMVIFISKNDPLDENTEAILLSEDLLPSNGKPPDSMKYILEVFLVKEVLEVWQKWRNGKVPDRLEKYQAVLYYVNNDAYQPADSSD